MSGGGSSKQKSKGIQQSIIDPKMYSALWGSGAVQPIYNKKGRLTNAAAVNAGGSSGGLLGTAQNLSQEPALNQTQTGALGGMAGYLTSPQALAGQAAMQNASNYLLGQMPGSGQMYAGGDSNWLANNPAADIGAGTASPGTIDWQAIRNAAAADLAKYQTPPQQVQGPIGQGMDYTGAVNQALSGRVDNPYLQQQATNAADLASQNWARNIAPVLRGGARMTGMYGGSRQGIAEGIAAGDLNRAITDATTNLYGGAYENAQNRAAAMAGQMAGYGQQAQLANQAAGLQHQGQLMNYDLGAQGMGINAGQLGLANRQLTSQNAIQGANLAQQASQIPLANLQNLYGIGSTIQQAPWAQLTNYANLLYPQTNTGAAQRNAQTTTVSSGGSTLGGLASLGLGMLGGGGFGNMFGGGVTGLTNQQVSGALGSLGPIQIPLIR